MLSLTPTPEGVGFRSLRVIGIAAAVLAVELLYFERDVITEEVTEFEPDGGPSPEGD